MIHPPVLARALLRTLLPEHEVRDALEGDLEEGFRRRAAQSPGKAWRWYWLVVLRIPYRALRRQMRRLDATRGPTRIPTGGGGMGGTMMDLRIAARALWKRPAFSGVAVATLALSIGAATLLFSVVDGVLMTPLPYERPDELVTVYLTNEAWRDGENELLRASWDSYTLTLDHARAFREAPGPLTEVSGYTYRYLPLRADAGADDDAIAIMVDGHAFPVLGVAPALGRLPTAREVETSEKVAVLRHETWSSRFGGDPDVLGRAFGLGDDLYTVIGVMPPGFFFPTEEVGDLWIPIREEARDWPSYYGVARLAPGATTADATEFLERVARRMGEEDPERAGLGARAVPHLDNVVGKVRDGIRLLFGTALVVVLVACVNLANLFLARAAGRREELAIRASLGAGTGSLIRVLLSEAVVIGAVGGGLGIALAAGALDPFVAALGASLRGLPRQDTIGLHGGVLSFSLAATFTATVVAALAPTLSSARRAPAGALGNRRWSGSGERTRRPQRVLLATQAALTVVLVCAAGLLGRSLLELAGVDMGMDTDRVSVLEVEAETRYEGVAELASAFEAIRGRLGVIPGVSHVGIAATLPSQGGVLLPDLRPEGTPADRSVPVASVAASPGYFAALGIPIRVGRGLVGGDADPGATRVVVSESLALQFFGRVQVLDRRIVMDGSEGSRTMEIVGVAAEARQLSPFQEPTPTLYYPLRPSQSEDFFVAMAVDGDPGAVLETAGAVLTATDARLDVRMASTLHRMLLDGTRHVRLSAMLMAALAALAGILAMVGISGVVAHYMSEHMREVGIRMALGAAAGREVGRVVRHALTPTVLGLGVGVVAAVASSRVMERFLFGIEPTDPVTYGAVAGLTLLAAWLAAWVPARRAAAVDPARVLNGG